MLVNIPTHLTLGTQSHAHVLGQLIGLDFSESTHVKCDSGDSQEIRNRSFHTVAQVLRRMSAQCGGIVAAPILLFLEDLHWADTTSLDFVQYLSQVNRDVPTLILAFARPLLFEDERAKAEALFAESSRIVLAPLDARASRDLVHDLLKQLPIIPPTLREMLMTGSEGNPFYMEEFVKMLIDEGALVASSDRWEFLADKLITTKIPSTLTGILQARLDRLPATERRALQSASVIGVRFWDKTLAHIDDHALGQLPALKYRNLVFEHRDALDDAREFSFKHQILHQVTYDTVLKSQRRGAHEKAAEWFANATGARARDCLGLAAEHYAKAGVSDMAREFFTRAAEEASRIFANELALHYVALALNFTAELEMTTEWRLRKVRENVLGLLGRRQEQLVEIETLTKLAESLDDDLCRSDAAVLRSAIAFHIEGPEAIEREAIRAQYYAARTGLVAPQLRAERQLILALELKCELEAAKALANEGITRARSLGLRLEEMRFVRNLVRCAFRQGDPVTFLEYNRQCLSYYRETGDRVGEAIALGDFGLMYQICGALDESLQFSEEALRLTRALGYRTHQVGILCDLSIVKSRQGEDAMALVYAQEACNVAINAGSPASRLDGLSVQGNAELALGRFDVSEELFEQLRRESIEINQPASLVYALEGLARVALCEDSDTTRRSRLEQLLEVTLLQEHSPGYFWWDQEARVRLTLFRLMSCCDDARAAAMLDDAYDGVLAAADRIRDAMTCTLQ